MSEPRRRGRPARLTRDQIVRAARELLQRDGVEALTMRGVARAVGSTPMSLYHHVADKDELLLLLLDEEAATLSPPRLPDDPRDRLVALALFLRDRLNERPWVLQAVAPGARFGRPALTFVEQVVAAFVACGLAPDDAVRAYRALWYLIVGELTVRHKRSPGDARGSDVARDAFAALDPAEQPTLSAIGARWWEIEEAYAPRDGLAALVDGLITRHAKNAGGR